MEGGRFRDLVIVEVLVFVLERHVAIEVQRPQIGEVLHLVGRVQPWRHRRQRHDEEDRERGELAFAEQEEPADCFGQGDSMLPQRHVLDDLREVETGMADHRRDDAAAAEVDEAPDRAEGGGGDRGVVALLVMAEAEKRAVDDDSDQTAAEILPEAMDDEAALDLFANAAREHHDDREDRRVGVIAQHVFQRVARHVVQLRRELQDQPDDHADGEED